MFTVSKCQKLSSLRSKRKIIWHEWKCEEAFCSSPETGVLPVVFSAPSAVHNLCSRRRCSGNAASALALACSSVFNSFLSARQMRFCLARTASLDKTGRKHGGRENITSSHAQSEVKLFAPVSDMTTLC